MANLVIIESPYKAPTIKSYLGSNYKVIASKGHLRDLPKSSLGIDIENGFEAHYINIRGKGDLIKEIKKEAKAANKIYLATDPDREGEAIAWHVANVLGIPLEKTMRVTFNEITKSVVKSAIKQPRTIDMDVVNAQQTRRILDRIVGYKLSPLLWKNVKSGLSAGRVQSVATRIIVEREEEIRNFVPVEYWTIDAELLSDGKPFTVKFYGNADGKMDLANEEQAMAIVDAISKGSFKVAGVTKAERAKAPTPPFITSTLQQEASKKLSFQSQRTMRVAQELYEGINVGAENGGVQGLITYMRTDSLRVSAEAQEATRRFIGERYGEQFNTEEPRIYKTKSGAQDAHEAIRPSNVNLEPQKIKAYLTPDQFKIYKLIWERFVASQMQSASLATVSVDIENSGYIFRAASYTVTFPGYMAIYEESEDELTKTHDELREVRDGKIPAICEGDILGLSKTMPAKHFTEAPKRYTEATLIKFLEEKGIGRPSTFSSIITTIIQRNYVKRDGKSLVPTSLGEITNDLMLENFNSVVDYKFTADIETRLDEIEKGDVTMLEVLDSFWEGFSVQLSEAERKLEEKIIEVPVEETDIICEKCGSRMVVKNGKFGKFIACPNYPRCRNTKPFVTEDQVAEKEEIVEIPVSPEVKPEEAKEEKKLIVADFKCEKCGGDMVLRTGRFGSFYACVNYPNCKTTKAKQKDIGVACPECGSKVVMKHGKNKTVFYSCEKYPECGFSSWDMPTNERCPDCGKILFRKKGKPVLVCHTDGCKFTKPAENDGAEA